MGISSFNDFYLCFFLPFYISDTIKKPLNKTKLGFRTNQSKAPELN